MGRLSLVTASSEGTARAFAVAFGALSELATSVYGLAMVALSCLTRVLSWGWAPKEVRVNALAPTTLLREYLRRMLAEGPQALGGLRGFEFGLFAEPEDLMRSSFSPAALQTS